MNTTLLITFLTAGISAIALGQSGPAIPGAPLEWTSNDHRTIRARFVGAGPDRVLIEMQGLTYVVPFSRLSATSVAQAQRLRGFAEELRTVASAPSLSPPQAPRAEPISIRLERSSQLSIPPVSALSLQGRIATATVEVPDVVQRAIDAGNVLQTKPYKWGGGRAPLEDTGYDCSGSVSYVLIKAGLLRAPLTSRGFTNYGEPGPGKWITIYARPGHVFMTICGLRLDTGGRGGVGESGPRWSLYPRNGAGCSVRHPPGF